jgi:NAD(P)-dependent dehydrogenase (short-subunit alcohol dehydrogenase family)
MSINAAAAPLTFLVTGANRGIGLAFAKQLSQRGDRVIATARQPEKARELGELSVRVEPLDVSDEESVARLAHRLDGERVDVLVNNAGIGEAGPGIARLKMEDLERAFRVNAIGPLDVTRALLPNLRAGRRRLVVSLSSGLGSVSGNREGGWYAYRAAKAALNQLTRTMAAELRNEGFTFVVMSPGWVRTDMGGAGAPLSADDSVAAMLRVIDRLSPSDTGRFLDQKGRAVEW